VLHNFFWYAFRKIFRLIISFFFFRFCKFSKHVHKLIVSIRFKMQIPNKFDLIVKNMLSIRNLILYFREILFMCEYYYVSLNLKRWAWQTQTLSSYFWYEILFGCENCNFVHQCQPITAHSRKLCSADVLGVCLINTTLFVFSWSEDA